MGFFRRTRNQLDDELFRWTKHDAFTVRDMLRSVEVKGITGSGKSSGSLKLFAESLVKHPKATLLVIAQKPEEKQFFVDLFKKHNKRLIVFEEHGDWRMNFLDTEREAGADARGLVEFLTTLGESIEGGQSGGRENDRFWKKLEERITFSAVELVRQGTGSVTTPELAKVIVTAPYSLAQISDENWKANFNNKLLGAMYDRNKTPLEKLTDIKARVEKFDAEVVREFWLGEFPAMDPKPRSSGLAGVTNTLHTANVGLVREMTSTTTNVTPQMMEEGVSVLVNFPFPQYGPSGRYIAGGVKYIWQKHILRRHVKPDDYFNVIIMDEYQESATEFDARYIAQCRSHYGALLCLTQTVNSEFVAMAGQGNHRAKQLLSNYGHHIFHLCDPDTAAYASGLLGQRLMTTYGGTEGERESVGDVLLGESAHRGNFSTSFSPILQPQVFMGGDIRTGGRTSGYMVDGYVIRAGASFSNGENYLKVGFSQR